MLYIDPNLYNLGQHSLQFLDCSNSKPLSAHFARVPCFYPFQLLACLYRGQLHSLIRQMQKGQGVKCRVRSVRVPSVSSHSWIHILSGGLNSLLLRLDQQDSRVQFEALWVVCCSSIKHFCYLTHPDPHFHSPAKGLAPFSPHSCCLCPLHWPSSFGKTSAFFSPGLSVHPYCSIPLLCTTFGYIFTSYFLS